jgi:hypothetical protein
VEAHHTFSLPAASRRSAYRVVIPIAALCLYGALGLLWCVGAHSTYSGVLHLVGVEAFSSPFVDTGAVLAAADCWREGIDVYLFDPCDALGRPHVYSPLWLAIVPDFLGRSATGWLGLGLGLLFIISWAAVLRPRTAAELSVLGLAALSPMTVYALERANNDLVVFLLILGGALLFTTSRAGRLCSYALWVAAGLLKYYPLALLILLAREHRRDAMAAAIAAGLMLVSFAFYFHAELGKSLANIPAASYFTDSFSAANLPFGFGEALRESFSRSVTAITLLSILCAVALARGLRTMRALEREALSWNGREMQCLVIGSLLVTACFFGGQNVNYRGIYFLLVLPGLIRLRRSSREAAISQLSGLMIAAVLFVMWEEPLRHSIHAVVAPAPSSGGLGSQAEVFFWLGRELVWWWLIAGLAAIVLAYLRSTPLAQAFCKESTKPAPLERYLDHA